MLLHALLSGAACLPTLPLWLESHLNLPSLRVPSRSQVTEVEVEADVAEHRAGAAASKALQVGAKSLCFCLTLFPAASVFLVVSVLHALLSLSLSGYVD